VHEVVTDGPVARGARRGAVRVVAIAIAAAVGAAGGMPGTAAYGAAAGAPSGAPSAFGTWLADDGKSHVRIHACGAELCGRVTWIRDPLGADGKPRTDVENPDASKRSQPIVGLEVLAGFVADESAPGQWEGGTIYDPEEGKTYKCTLALQDANTLRVHGYVGIALFGKTQIWTRLPS
jgi:uncharacterized protein (DUF2147 family)